MLFKNPTESRVLVRLKQGASYQFFVEPNEVVDIDDKFAKPRLAENGGRRASVIEEIAPQLRPADPEDEQEWLKTPAFAESHKPGVYIPTVQELVRMGTPRGVAIKMVEQAIASQTEALKVYQETELLKVKEHVREAKEAKKALKQ